MKSILGDSILRRKLNFHPSSSSSCPFWDFEKYVNSTLLLSFSSSSIFTTALLLFTKTELFQSLLPTPLLVILEQFFHHHPSNTFVPYILNMFFFSALCEGEYS